jgi:hypothetical protein
LPTSLNSIHPRINGPQPSRITREIPHHLLLGKCDTTWAARSAGNSLTIHWLSGGRNHCSRMASPAGKDLPRRGSPFPCMVLWLRIATFWHSRSRRAAGRSDPVTQFDRLQDRWEGENYSEKRVNWGVGRQLHAGRGFSTGTKNGANLTPECAGRSGIGSQALRVVAIGALDRRLSPDWQGV